MTGALGASAIAATGLGQLLVFVVMTIFWGLSTGATVVIAHLTGSGEVSESRKAASTSFTICIVLTIVASTVGATNGESIVKMMGGGDDIQLLAASYIRLVFLWLIFTTGLNILSGIMHGRGDTKTPMQGIIIVNILHILIGYLIIYGKFGFPKLGVEGAAIAINISEAIGFFYLLIQAVKKRYIAAAIFDVPIFKRIWRVGWPVALERIAQQSGQLFYSSFIISYGTSAYAAHQIGVSIESLSFMPGAGMGIAAASLMGQALGAKKIKRAKISHNEALRLALIVMGIMALIFLIFPKYLILLFTSSPDVVEKGVVFLRLVAFAQIPLAISFVYAGSLRGMGDTFYVFIITLIAMWGIRVAFSYIASHQLHLSLYAVWSVFLIDWYFRGAAFSFRYYRKKLAASGV